MRLLNKLTCHAIGHEPRYFQARMMINGRWGWHKHARCARRGSSNSLVIHTPGYLDVSVWLLLGVDALRFAIIEWHRGRRRALARLFRKRTS
jgi:transposase